MELDPSISAIVSGIILPFILPLILQTKWSSTVKSLLTLGIAIIVGIINAVITGRVSDVAVVLTGVVVVYQSLNKTGVFNDISKATDFHRKIDEVPTPEEGYQADIEEEKKNG